MAGHLQQNLRRREAMVLETGAPLEMAEQSQGQSGVSVEHCRTGMSIFERLGNRPQHWPEECHR